MNPNHCLTDNELTHLRLERLTAEQQNRCREHIDGCVSCREKFDRMSGHDRLSASETATEDTTKIGDPYPELPGYRIEKLIGRGGIGLVYKARHEKLQRHVAIKCLPHIDGKTGERFAREIVIVGRLNHPNIVRAYDAGRHVGTHYFVMEFIDGVDLSQCIRMAGSLSIADACEVVRQTATALQYTHEQGLIHRDIKPANLMLASDGTIKLLDLGLSRLADREGSSEAELTLTSELIGTVDFIAPEQINGSRTLGIEVDVYGLGASFFQMLTGRCPFSGPKYPTLPEKLKAITEGSAPRVNDIRPDVPDPIAQVISRMLHRDPKQRFGEPAEVARAVEPFCASADLCHLHDRVRNGGDAKSSAATTKPRSRRSALGIFSGISGLAVVCSIGFWFPWFGWNNPTGTPGTGQAAAAGLIALYHFDETDESFVRDSAGTNHGTAYGDLKRLPSMPRSSSNDAILFDGFDDYVQLSQILPIGDGSHTIEVWVKVPEVSTGNLWPFQRVGIILGNHIDAPNSNWEIHSEGQIRIFWNNRQLDLYGSTDLRDDQWHHLAIVRDTEADEFLAYVDGVEEPLTEHSWAGDDIVFTTTHRIGHDNRATAPILFHGEMDELAIYDAALAPETIQENARRPRK